MKKVGPKRWNLIKRLRIRLKAMRATSRIASEDLDELEEELMEMEE